MEPAEMIPNYPMPSQLIATPAPERYDLFEQYFDFIADMEPPMIYHRWCLITALGALLGRRVYLPFGTSRIFPQHYVMLIGEPGARKSTAIKLCKSLVVGAGYSTLAANKTTKEKFILDMESAAEKKMSTEELLDVEALLGASAGKDPAERFIVADEFNDFMNCCDLPFHSLLGQWWDWDEPDSAWTYRLKNSKSVAIYQPTISLLGGNTHTNFAEMFPPQALGQGFLSRMLLIYSTRSTRSVPFPVPRDPDKKAKLVDAIRAVTSISGEASISDRARNILSTLYNTYAVPDDSRLSSYSQRRHTHLLKLCMICAVVRGTLVIDQQDVIYAHSILSYAEHFMPQAFGEFGKSKNADVQQRILSYITSAKEAVDVVDIWKQVSSDLESIDGLVRILAGLQQAGKIAWRPKSPTAPQSYVAVERSIEGRKLFTNWELLREYRNP
jgi:hypothetical protein